MFFIKLALDFVQCGDKRAAYEFTLLFFLKMYIKIAIILLIDNVLY